MNRMILFFLLLSGCLLDCKKAGDLSPVEKIVFDSERLAIIAETYQDDCEGYVREAAKVISANSTRGIEETLKRMNEVERNRMQEEYGDRLRVAQQKIQPVAMKCMEYFQKTQMKQIKIHE